MSTESRSDRYVDIDRWASEEVMAAMFEAQLAGLAAMRASLPALVAAGDAMAERLAAAPAGRIVYVGAGTSGRIGVQDGAELNPTFSWPHERIRFLMAGGEGALLKAVEGAEDDTAAARRDVAAHAIGADDVVIAVAASGTTPYTIAALEAARTAGALAIAVVCSPGTPLAAAAEHAILIETGAEVIAGSTRMKAGTAQKVALNLLSTFAMIRLGRVCDGLMVHMRVSNAKLRRRGAQMVARLAGASEGQGAKALAAADGDVRVATLIARGLGRQAADALLDAHGGNLRRALDALSR